MMEEITMTRRNMVPVNAVLTMLCLWCAVQVAAAPGFSVPAGTQISTIKFKDVQGAAVQLKPAEQVAFLFVYGISNLESQCTDKFFGGTGKLCTLEQLVKGVPRNGGAMGLTADPAQDANYRYRLEIIGTACVITAVPQHPGLGAFAYVGSPGGFGHGDVFYNPDGADMTQARALGEMGYSGDGFVRSH
jgi:hypothetical protein